MTLRTLILRSLRFHARSHLGVLLGATLGSAILIGALLVGDSVRGSLRDMALARLGKIEAAMATGDRLFRAELATSLKAAPVLALPGTANSADGARRANRVHVLGVDENFWKLAEKAPPFATVPPDSVVLNQALADQLAAKPGDEVLLRINKVSALSQDVALTTRDGQSVALRLRVHAVVGNGQLGRFSLQANQVAPFNAFVALGLLQDKASAAGLANLSATARSVKVPPQLKDSSPPVKLKEMDAAPFANELLPLNWNLQDAQLELRSLTNSPALELRTDRIFLDPPAVRAALAVDTNAQPILTYLATLLRAGTNATAYPMVTAAGAPLVPADLRDDEIVLNQWLADQLRVAPGRELEVSYFLPDSGARLTEATNRFRVRSIVPMQMPWADRTLMPDFPGIAKAERIGDWDAGFPLTHRKLVDDPYWKQWRGTPKAFVSLSAGRKMWGNRFGDTTAVRFALNSEFRIPNGESAATNALTNSPFAIRHSQSEKALLTALKPADFGLVFQPVREQALKASREGQDFGGLFIGFSFFLIVAACVLVALLFQFGVEQRAKEVGTLLALGFTPRQVRRLLLGEGAGLAVLGAALGAVGAVWYARAMLHGLSTVWRDAVGTSDLRFHAEPATLAGGFAGAVLVAVFSLWLALRKQVRQPARVLLAGGGDEGMGSGVLSLGNGARADAAAGQVARHSDVGAGAAKGSREVAGAVLPHPGPLPLGEGTATHAARTSDASGSDPAKSAPGFSQARTAPLPLPAGEGRGEGESILQPAGRVCSSSPRPKSLLLSLSSLLLALALLGWALATGQTANAGAFFGAGALLLIAALAFTAALLTRLERSEAAAALNLASLGIRNTTRRRSRSLATVTMLACGSFLVLSIGVFRLDENANATKRSSGIGGFALLGESTLPVVQDLNTKAGREALGLDERSLEGVSVVPFRVRDGDDASCLNLNRAQKPRLLGVKPELLAERKAFEFAGVAKGLAKEDGWKLLNGSSLGHALPPHPNPLPEGEGTATNATGERASSVPASATVPASPTQPASLPLPKGEGRGEGKGNAPFPATATPAPPATKQNPIPHPLDAIPSSSLTDPIPAIADMNSILWAMGKKVGDIIEYPEPDERGRPVRLRLVGAVANSILQGNLIIAEDEFTARFPSEAGYRYFLVDAPTNRVADVSATLTRALRDFGLELTPATRRMAQLNAVQNTYLGTFQILGGLGLLLGSAGLGVVVLRNVLERRGELALLLALGFRAKALRWLVLSEHAALLVLGLFSGVVAAVVAVLPSVLGAGELPAGALALTLGGVLASGLVWTWLATVSALRGQLLDALRNQ